MTLTNTQAAPRITWTAIRRSLTRPYPVTIPMVVFVLLVPLYLVIDRRALTGVVHTPAIALDGLIPLLPWWALVYGPIYLFLLVLPVFVIQQEELIHRTVRAYLAIWITAFLCFLLYPTVATRPNVVTGDGFAAWGLRFLYDADPPHNCFPSLHVAHSFVSAFACYRVNRRLGLVTGACASLVALSTLFTKQHYVADLVAGFLLALVAWAIFLRGYSLAKVPELDRRVAPGLAIFAAGLVAVGVACFWVAYEVRNWV